MIDLPYLIGRERKVKMVDLTEEQKAEVEKAKQEAIAKAVADKEAELKKKHDEEMANLRIKSKQEKEEAVKKAEQDAKLTAEEKAKKELEEQQKAEHDELIALRQEKKLNERAKKLVEAGVPEMFKNDSRLINAEDDKVEEVIKTINEEWKKLAPNGANTNTNVMGGGSNTDNKDKFAQFRSAGFKK